MYGEDTAFWLLAVMALAAAFIASRIWRKVGSPLVLILGVLLRILGSLAYFEVIMSRYGGAADAIGYFRRGMAYADRLALGDFGGFLSGISSDERWWGTAFVDRVSGVVLSVIGPNLKAEFLVFALLSFLGLVAMVIAVGRINGSKQARSFAALVFVWPSLWFWPSTVGKESLVLLGIGLAFLGYVGARGKPLWPWLVVGVLLVFFCRPHVALVLMLGMLVAHVLRPGVRVSMVRAAQLVVIGLATCFIFFGMARLFGIEEGRQRGMGEFVEMKSENTLRGGSSLDSTPIQEGKPWLALPNFWLRPFPWEATSLVSAFAATEMVVFWLAVVLKRKRAWANLKSWRQDAGTRFALPTVLGYSLMLGSIIGNLGILVRQRTLILPLAFLLIVAQTGRSRPPKGGWVNSGLPPTGSRTG